MPKRPERLGFRGGMGGGGMVGEEGRGRRCGERGGGLAGRGIAAGGRANKGGVAGRRSGEGASSGVRGVRGKLGEGGGGGGGGMADWSVSGLAESLDRGGDSSGEGTPLRMVRMGVAGEEWPPASKAAGASVAYSAAAKSPSP